MSSNAANLGPSKVARITGGLYLAYIAAMVLADTLGHIGTGTAQQVYQAIVTNAFSFRLGLVIAFMSAFLPGASETRACRLVSERVAGASREESDEPARLSASCRGSYD